MQVKKRDGTRVPFNSDNIYKAIYNCLIAHGDKAKEAEYLALHVVMSLNGHERKQVSVEQIGDMTVSILREHHSNELADRYSNYRQAHAVSRAAKAYENDPFPTPLQRFQFYDKYSRYNHETRRRETWAETVTRGVDYLRELSGNRLDSSLYKRIYDGIYNLQVMPSMRLLAMAGKAARKNQISVYNCSALPIDSLDAFHEILLICMSGTGVGVSVESQYTTQLPIVERTRQKDIKVWRIADSTEGWVEAFAAGIKSWYSGRDIRFDYSFIRPKGAVLKTKGGRSSGKRPLIELMQFAKKTIRNAVGRKLTTLECHDIVCKIGSVVIQGGVRRTAMLSLFDIDDEEMLHCKDADNIIGNEQRWFANNSAVWTGRRTFEQVLEQMEMIAKSGTGEPNLFSRKAVNFTKPERRRELAHGLINPCGEIALRGTPVSDAGGGGQFCNLSVAIARLDDTLSTLLDKIELATIIGTIQAMATDFNGLRPKWKENCEEERLLGVDIIGQMDCPLVQEEDILKLLKQKARRTNIDYATKLGINPAAAITCVKPSGNSSVLLDASPGIHARHAPYYIRRVRISADSPMLSVLRHSVFALTPENGQTEENATTWVASFPVKSPEGAITKRDRTALQQLEYWLMVKKNYTEHSPSCTITFYKREIEDIAKFLSSHQEWIGGLSFLPADENEIQYEQLPYEEITKQEYEAMLDEMPEIDYSWLTVYETSDSTTVAQQLACISGLCNI